MRPNTRFILALALVSLIAAGQDTRPSLKLPETDQGKPGAEKDLIRGWVLRKASGAASRPKSTEADWLVQVEHESYRFDRDGLAKLQAALTKLADEKLSEKEPRVSERTLVVAADAEAPYGLVQKVLGAAAVARLNKIELATSSGSLMTPLPVDEGAQTRESEAAKPVGEVKVLLAWSSAASKVERLFGTDTAVPVTPDGDRKLEELIKADVERFKQAGTTDVHLVIDSGPGVPWQTIVDVMSIARRAGVEKIQYGMGIEAPK